MGVEITEENRSAPEVFLSYSHNDSEAVEKIAQKLSEAGLNCWIDKDRLRAGENYNASIDTAIKASFVFISFFSETYVNKKYCQHEFDVAVDSEKSILTVCIDRVTEEDNKQFAYAFSFAAGHNILGYKSGVEDDSDIDRFAEGIIRSVQITALKRYLETGDPSDLPPSCTPEYIISQLRQYHESQYVQSGNYALNEIRGELFPAIAVKDPDGRKVYRDEEKQDVSLIKYISGENETNLAGKHILIVGEGGMGKTVSLLNTCKYLLDRKINAIYIPLSKICSDMTIDKYISDIVCGRNDAINRNVRQIMSREFTDVPNMVLLLDGINEVPQDHVEKLIKKEIKDTYINSCRGVRLIMTSRWFDNSLMHSIENDVALLEMQPLDDDAVANYLSASDMPPVSDPKLLSVIKTPLMLTLYSNVRRHKEKYSHIEGIELEDNPKTAGKIIGNFFQAQLYRAAEEANFNRADHLVLLDYLLPAAAYRMLKNESKYISEDELLDIKYEIEDMDERYKLYKRIQLDKIKRIGKPDSDNLLDLAESSLHFLHKTDEGCEFLHQNFRDYFAAHYITNEILCFYSKPEGMKNIDPVLEECIYPAEILSLASDILSEEAAQPQMTDSGWVFPGKDSTAPSEFSKAEAILHLWKDRTDEKAQNAVANLFGIMKTGRADSTAWCDFSGLDMRKCQLNGCRFSEWYKDKIYPSIFDGAYIDRRNFLSDGHEAPVSAMASDGKKFLFSGDENGTVKIFDIEKNEWCDEFRLFGSRVMDLAWDEEYRKLAVLYEKSVFVYSVPDGKAELRKDIRVKTHRFRYVYFAENHQLQVSYDMEPLVRYDLNGNVYRNGLESDVPVKCAKWNPVKKEYVRGNLCQLLTINRCDEKTQSWKIHPVISKRWDDAQKNGEKWVQRYYLSLSDFISEFGKSVECIEYYPDGSRFLVAVGHYLLEIDSESLSLLNKKKFDSKVQCACYMNGGAAAASDSDIVLLTPDFSEKGILHGSHITSIIFLRESYDGDDYYLLSSNGEVKKLSPQMTVKNIRIIDGVSRFAWGKDRLTNCVQMVFRPCEKFPSGARYSYDTDVTEPLGWRYTLFYASNDISDYEQRWYIMGSQIMMFESEPPYNKRFFNNYAGFFIYGCSFRNIKGDLEKEYNIQLLQQNGGIIGNE